MMQMEFRMNRAGLSPTLGMADVPAPPIAPEGGAPVAPGPVYPVPPIAPEGGAPVAPGPVYPVPPIAPEGGAPVAPGPVYPVPPIAPEGGAPVAPGPVYPVPPIAWPGFPIPDFDVPVPPIAPEPGIPVYPGPAAEPCRVRVLHAAVDVAPLRVAVGRTVVAQSVSYGHASDYSEVGDGFLTVTVTMAARPRTMFLRVNMPFRAGSVLTLAVLSTRGGMSVMQIVDGACCRVPSQSACLRTVNLSPGSPALDVLLYGGWTIFGEVSYKEVTPYRLARPGSYQMYITPTPTAADPGIGAESEPEALVSFDYDAKPGAATTAYLIGVIGEPETPFTVLQVRDR